MQKILRRVWAEINMDALQHNYAAIRGAMSPGVRCMAVVKADAYGHGAVPIVKMLEEQGVDYLAVANLDEALQLRYAGVTLPILLLSYTPPAAATVLAQYTLTQTLISAEHAAALSAAAVAAGVQVTVHLKIDTGMARVGFVHHTLSDRETAAAEVVTAARLPGLIAEGIFTHFACADEPDETPTRKQFARFMQTIEDAERAGVTFPLRHCCNSAALERFPDMQLDMVRPGIILYGQAPDDGDMQALLPLQPVMQLKTAISQIKTLPAGQPVSYGGTYITARTTTVATVPIGYADGYPRVMAGRAHMLLHGQPVPLIGRVCMDQCMLDITGVAAAVGDEVTVFGKMPSTAEVAGWMGTISYEALCMVGKRVPRVYLRGEAPYDVENLILGSDGHG